MVNKIITVKEAVKVSKKLGKESKRIVLAGGCFDILHVGHVVFLKEAKAAGDALFVFLESDETVERLKGQHRPINAQQDRARVLSALDAVDYVVLLPQLTTNTQYDEIVTKLKPSVIAVTEGDPAKTHKERQAKATGAKVVAVAKRVKDSSSSRLTKLLSSKLHTCAF